MVHVEDLCALAVVGEVEADTGDVLDVVEHHVIAVDDTVWLPPSRGLPPTYATMPPRRISRPT